MHGDAYSKNNVIMTIIVKCKGLGITYYLEKKSGTVSSLQVNAVFHLFSQHPFLSH